MSAPPVEEVKVGISILSLIPKRNLPIYPNTK
jgi:hypothetical protein